MFNVLDASHTEVTLYRHEGHSSTPAPHGAVPWLGVPTSSYAAGGPVIATLLP